MIFCLLSKFSIDFAANGLKTKIKFQDETLNVTLSYFKKNEGNQSFPLNFFQSSAQFFFLFPRVEFWKSFFFLEIYFLQYFLQLY